MAAGLDEVEDVDAFAAGHAVIEVHALVADAELAQRVALRSEVLLSFEQRA
jgi:hypothetical protein